MKFAGPTGRCRRASWCRAYANWHAIWQSIPTTVARAYRELQEEGVLETVRGMGLAVAATARRHCQAERSKLIKARLHLALAEAQQSGLEVSEVESLVQSELANVFRARQKQS